MRPYLRVANVHEDRIDTSDVLEMNFTPEEFQRYALRHGDILLNEGQSLELVGRAAMYRDEVPGACFQNTLLRYRVGPSLDSRFTLLQFLWFLHSQRFKKIASWTTSIAHLGSTRFAAMELALPPKAEQLRIVDEVEKQFTRLDAAVAGLQRVKTNLKRYRASVLKAACEGRLVPTEAELARREGRSFESGEELLKRILKERRARWEADQLAKMKATGKAPRDDGWKGKYSQPASPESRSAAALPPCWTVASLDELSERLTSGSRDWSQFYGRGQGTFVLAQNVRPGRLDLSFRQAVDAPASDPSTERSRIRMGDLLLTIVGANTGDVCGVRQDVRSHFVCQSVALVRPVLIETSPFVEWFLVSQEHGQKQFRAFTYGQGRPHLGFEQIAATLIALPPLPEQHRIVAEVERRLSVVDELEATVEKNLARCARLRQSILKMAFEGRLVPQDPNDEPASMLLERIRRERDSADVAGAPPRRRKAVKR